jgi:hypothetical protein
MFRQGPATATAPQIPNDGSGCSSLANPRNPLHIRCGAGRLIGAGAPLVGQIHGRIHALREGGIEAEKGEKRRRTEAESMTGKEIGRRSETIGTGTEIETGTEKERETDQGTEIGTEGGTEIEKGKEKGTVTEIGGILNHPALNQLFRR